MPGGIRRYAIAIGSKECEAQAGPPTPSCTLTGLTAGKLYNASAYSIGDDYHYGLSTYGLVNTLPDGKYLSQIIHFTCVFKRMTDVLFSTKKFHDGRS